MARKGKFGLLSSVFLLLHFLNVNLPSAAKSSKLLKTPKERQIRLRSCGIL